MNYMSALPLSDAEAEAIYDEEEFRVPSDNQAVQRWASLEGFSGVTRFGLVDLAHRWSTLLDTDDVALTELTLRASDIAELWRNRSDNLFLESMVRADASLRGRLHLISHHLAGTPDAQLRLDIPGSFAPSSDLIVCWRENATHYLDPQALSSVKTIDASGEFVRMFKRLVGAFAQEKRHSGARSVVLVDNRGEFDSYFQLDVSERFLLTPQRSGSFFNLLYRDLSSCHSEIYAANWGALNRKPDGRLMLELNPPDRKRREGFVKARESRK